MVWVLMKRSRRGQREEAAETAGTPSPGEMFEAELNSIRQGVMEDPKVAASVVKLWMQA
jgi:flagellar biosynthesis/type III secretory pathway M-ring protein FliF/YscJ